MPEIVEEFPYVQTRGARSIYSEEEWEELLDGQLRKFTHGVDFTTKPISFRSVLRANAVKRGYRIITQRVGDDLYMQAVSQDTVLGPRKPQR